MRIPESTLQAIRSQTDLAGLVAEHTALIRRGSRLYGKCPFHEESSPSFSVDPERRLFFCFGCEAGGDAIRFVMLAKRCNFREAVELLARRAGVPLPAEGEAGEEAELVAALGAAAELFSRQLSRSAEAMRYLEGRGVPGGLVERFGLGYATPAWTALGDALSPRFGHRVLERAGLTLRSERSGSWLDRFRDRIVFPLHAPDGRRVGFAGRSLSSAKPVYSNSPESPLFHKREILFGYPLALPAIRRRKRVVVVEGYFDVLAYAAVGIDEVVAPMGTRLTAEQIRLLARDAGEVLVAYDSDPPGREAFRRALPALLSEGLAVRYVPLPQGHDPASLREQRGDEALAATVSSAEDALKAELARIATQFDEGDTLAHAQAITASLKLLALLPDAALRLSYTRLASRLLDVPATALLSALTQHRSGS